MVMEKPGARNQNSKVTTRFINMKRIIPFFIVLVFAVKSKAQETEPLKDTMPVPAIVVEKDPRLEVMYGKKIATSSEATVVKSAGSKKVVQDRYGNVMMPGYRLQVLNSTDRNLVYRTKAMLYQRFPGNGVYVVSQAPFFKLRFGNFTSKPDADRYKKILAPLFPSGVYVINDVIEARIKKPAPEKEDTKEKDKDKPREKKKGKDD
jgi:hypothetical protein